MKLTNLKEQLDKIGKDVVANIIKELLAADKKATGALINSLRYEVLETVDSVILNIISLDYFENVDKGRRAGAKPPPVKAIIPWVEAKGIKFKGSSVESTAFVIARSIGIKGIKPLNIKQKIIQDIINNKTQLIQQGYTKDILEDINNIIKYNK